MLELSVICAMWLLGFCLLPRPVAYWTVKILDEAISTLGCIFALVSAPALVVLIIFFSQPGGSLDHRTYDQWHADQAATTHP